MKFRVSQDNQLRSGEQAALDIGMFGDGSDSAGGDPILDGGSGHTSYAFATWNSVTSTYTLNRSIFCVNLTVGVRKTLNTAGFRIFCTGTLTNNGTISNAGNAGGNGVGAAAGAGGTALLNNDLGNSTSGGAGGAGSSATGGTGANGNTYSWMMGGAGGNGGAGANGISSNAGAAGARGALNYKPFRALAYQLQFQANNIIGGAGGAGGGGGGGNGSGVGGGGGGGGSGGKLFPETLFDAQLHHLKLCLLH